MQSWQQSSTFTYLLKEGYLWYKGISINNYWEDQPERRLDVKEHNEREKAHVGAWWSDLNAKPSKVIDIFMGHNMVCPKSPWDDNKT